MLHLQSTALHLSTELINKEWVERLEVKPERMGVFVARFGRLQDHLGDKLTPEILKQMLETPKSVIDNLNKMEKIGLLSSMLDWVEARNLRNRLVYEYVEDSEEFTNAVKRALELVPLLTESEKRYRGYATKFIHE